MYLTNNSALCLTEKQTKWGLGGRMLLVLKQWCAITFFAFHPFQSGSVFSFLYFSQVTPQPLAVHHSSILQFYLVFRSHVPKLKFLVVNVQCNFHRRT